MTWKRRLRYDPVPSLITSKDEALRYLSNRDLGNSAGPIEELWHLPQVKKIEERQQLNGSWKYRGGREQLRSNENYDQIESFRVLRMLIEKYGMSKVCVSVRNTAEFFFSVQTEEGDFRGICGQQYVPYYSAAIMELLIKGGYAKDERIERGFNWLRSIRQDDGGWAFPLRTVGKRLGADIFNSDTIYPDKSKPFSHLITGMVLRAYAAHPVHRKSKEALHAGEMLAKRFFKRDKYPDRQAVSFWTSFSFPFWFTDLLSSLDSLSLMGFDPGNKWIKRGLDWLIARQSKDGLWRLNLRAMARVKEPDSWISFAISRMFKRFFG